VEPFTCFASTTPGLDALLAAELRQLGVTPGETEPGGVEFAASREQLSAALLWLRSANRVTVRLARFHARSFAELERHAGRIDWSPVLAPGQPVHFRVTAKKSKLYHEAGIAERLERAVGAGNAPVRAALDAEACELPVTSLPRVQRIVVRVMRDEFTLSADASGALLHLRGYRQAVARAPLRETLAAALLLASGWPPDLPLFDPMCGSGTVVIEAAMLARGIAPGRDRRFAAESWPGMIALFDAARATARASERVTTSPPRLHGADRDRGAIAAATANAERAGVAQDITWEHAAISHAPTDHGAGLVVTNPPYGARIGERKRLRDLYATLGAVMRERRPGWSLMLLSADRMLEGQLGLPLQQRFHTSNGGIPVRAMQYTPEGT
jgi:putative N6-adenine-specific DNA methylase